MRALKAIVIILGILLVAGFGVLIWGISRQASRLAESPRTLAPATDRTVTDKRVPWQRLGLDQPPGTRIADVTRAGDLLVLHLFTDTPGTQERLVIIDPGSGTLVGTIMVIGK